MRGDMGNIKTQGTRMSLGQRTQFKESIIILFFINKNYNNNIYL